MFRTFQYLKKNKFSVSKVILTLITVNIITIATLLILAVIPQFYRSKDYFLEQTFVLNIVLIGLFLLLGINYVLFNAKSKAKPEGNLQLNEEEILFNNEKIALSEIQKLRIIGNDVKGDFRGFISKGIKNEFIISLKNGTEKHVFFEQTNTNNLRNLKNTLEIYYKKGIITETNYYNILNNTNYY